MTTSAEESAGYTCPVCRQPTPTSVRRTVPSPTEIIRTRECPAGHRWHTREVAADHEFKVHKRNDRIVPFERTFVLQKSIALAGGGALTERAVADVADRVVRRLKMRSGQPVESEAIGSAVIAELSKTSRLAALRYASIFRPSREDLEIDDFLRWARREFKQDSKPHWQPGPRPAVVVKRSHPMRNPGYSEDFQVGKLKSSFDISTRRLTAKVRGNREIEKSELSGALTAWVLRQVEGQPIVSSAQLSAASLFVLRAVCPFGYVRYAAIAKQLGTTDAFLDELAALRDAPSPWIDLTPYLSAGKAINEELGDATP